MNCHDIEQKLKPFLEDLLTEDEYQEVCGHLDRCAQCRQYAVSTGSLSYLLKELGAVDTPKDLSATTCFRLQKITDRPLPDASFPDGKPPALWRRYSLPVVIAASIFFVAWWVVFKTGPKTFKASDTSVRETDEATEGMSGEAKGKSAEQAPVDEESAEQIYHRLQMIANTLGAIPEQKVEDKEETKPGPTENQTLAIGAPLAAGPVLADEPADGPVSVHWHIPYSRDSQREQLINTVRVLGIHVDYEDGDFLVFKATYKQLKLLIDGIQFETKAEMNVPEFMSDERFPDRIIPVSILFVRRDDYSAGRADIPIVKKNGVFVSFEQQAPAGENVLDWHFLMIPEQRANLLGAIREADGKINYTSDDVVVFLIHGARLETLANKIRSLGGIFADFGNREIGDGAVVREMVKVLIHLKEQ